MVVTFRVLNTNFILNLFIITCIKRAICLFTDIGEFILIFKLFVNTTIYFIALIDVFVGNFIKIDILDLLLLLVLQIINWLIWLLSLLLLLHLTILLLLRVLIPLLL